MEKTTSLVFEHVENEKFNIKVFAHDQANGAAAVPCWTFVTSGFMKLGQKEFVFTIRRKLNEEKDNPPLDVVDIFKVFYEYAAKETFVDVGDVSGFQAKDTTFLGFTGVVGFAYIRPQVLDGVDLPGSEACIAAILLVPGEVEFSLQAGPYRVTSRLARQSFYFPCPPWSDRSRESMITTEDLEKSLINRLPFVVLTRSYFTISTENLAFESEPGQLVEATFPRGTATLFIHSKDTTKFIDLLQKTIDEPTNIIGMGLSPARQAAMQLVWKAEGNEHAMNSLYSSKASVFTGGFVAFGFDEGTSENGCYIEDGIVFIMTKLRWLKVRDKLMRHEEVRVAPTGPGGLGLTVKFLGTSKNPWWKIW